MSKEKRNMLSFDATQYAMKFAKAHESDKVFIENNTFKGLLNQTQEEMGECIAAIGKYKRAIGEGPITPVPEDEALNNVIEELADAISIGLALADKMGWLDEMIDLHIKKSNMTMNRILDKQKKDGVAE